MKGSRDIVFVGGIHGVGKSTICRRLCADLSLEYLSASVLIAGHKAETTTNNRDNGKLVANIDENQDVLLKALSGMTKSGLKCLMDGHFTLFDSKKQIQRIPSATFAAIMPIVLIVLVDDPASILDRLSRRDGNRYDLQSLTYMQEQELSYAKQIGMQLSLDVYEVAASKVDYLEQIVKDTFSQ